MSYGENKLILKAQINRAGWCMPVISIQRRPMQKDHKFKVSLGYIEKDPGAEYIERREIGAGSRERERLSTTATIKRQCRV